MEFAAAIITAARWWLYIGAIVAFVFLSFGIDRIDENARGSYIFRPLLVPAILLIWPVVLCRWFYLERYNVKIMARYRPLRNAHAPTWFVLGILIPALFITALIVRQQWPTAIPAVQIDVPSEATEQ